MESLPNISPEDLATCLDVLQKVADNPSLIDRHERFKGLVAKIHRRGRRGIRRAGREQRRAEDDALREQTGMVGIQKGEEQPVAAPPETPPGTVGTLRAAIQCYVCKTPFRELHFHYHLLCPTCANFNYQKRLQRADLTGRTALVTGGRIKIGAQIVLRLLRDGARVIVTTRFPADAARRFAETPDFSEWRERLTIHGLDLRRLPDVEAFASHLLATETDLDILINNAAQTVRRPAAFYRHLIDGESPDAIRALPGELQHLLAPVSPGPVRLLDAPDDPANVLAESTKYFPAGQFDADGQAVDLRPVNSWTLKLDEVPLVEMVETQLVGFIAPFILNSRLKPLLAGSPFARRFIVNVSAMEGQFNRRSKTAFHPHTNMAKAALNMMTRTSAADYAEAGIFMNSVDTGWVTDENPHPKHRRIREEQGFFAPLDVVDGMARVYDPVARGVTEPETPLFGHFLKDYAPYPW